MKAVIIGYGTMGHEIEKVLLERGHTVILIVDVANRAQMTADLLRQADVAIEFTTPDTAYENVSACLAAGLPVVCGTTGWNDKRVKAENRCNELDGTLFWSSNFSIGVNVLFRVNRYLAKIMDHFPEYNVSMCEVHHTRKKDAPSGTAVTLAEGILEGLERKNSWVNHETLAEDSLGIVSIREGDVPGLHEIRYESEADVLTLKHEAKGRRGLAVGAVLAAEFAYTRKGVLKMDDLIEL